MSTSNKFDAVGPMAGMIYQVYYYLKKLLSLQLGESASLELYDDVAVAGEKGLVYCQLKHTGENTKVMTPRDHDLWKTLAMWVEIVKTNRNKEEQRQWLKNSQYVLLTNKVIDKNPLYNKLLSFNKDPSKWAEVLEHLKIQANKNNGKKNDVDKYASVIYKYPLKKELLSRVIIKKETDDEILEDISLILKRHKHVRENNVRILRTLLLGRLNESFANTIQKMKPSEYDDESFDNQYGPLIRSLKDRVFVRRTQYITLPNSLKINEQPFIRQLVDIDDPKASTEKRRIMLTRERLAFENDYHEALTEVSEPQQKAFEEHVHSIWDTIFWDKNNGIESKSEEDVKSAARSVLTSIRLQNLPFVGDENLGDSSTGCYYYFSDGDHPTIGWRYDWLEKYNGKDWIEIYG